MLLCRTCFKQFLDDGKVGVRDAVVQSCVAVAVSHVSDMSQN